MSFNNPSKDAHSFRGVNYDDTGVGLGKVFRHDGTDWKLVDEATLAVGMPFLNVRTETSNYVIQAADDVILSDGSLTHSLPAAPSTGKVFYVKHTDNGDSNDVTVDTVGAPNIIGAGGSVSSVPVQQWESLTFLFDGTDYQVI